MKNFLGDFALLFDGDTNPEFWTVILSDKNGKVIYSKKNLFEGELVTSVSEVKERLVNSGTIERETYSGVYGVSQSYVDKAIKEDIAGKIRSLYFQNESYIWIDEILNYEGGENSAIRRVHPSLKENEVKYLTIGSQDYGGNITYMDESDNIKVNGDGFISYDFKKINSDTVSEKIAYVKLYEYYDGVIGMGMHLDDLKLYADNINNENKALISEMNVNYLPSCT